MSNTAEVVFELEMGEDWTELNMVSFVAYPAIRTPFLKFNQDINPFHFTANEDRQIVTGPVLIPNLIIPRRIGDVLFNVVIRTDQIAAIYDKFMESESYKKTNFMHQKDQPTHEQCHLYEIFLTDSTRGIMSPKGFEDLPEGTIYMSHKITDPGLWAKIKAGDINGYSIEGNFKMVVPDADNNDPDVMQVLRELEDLVRNS